MDASTASNQSTIAARSWPQRLRLALGALLIWAFLQFLLNATLMAPGLARPATLAASNHPALAGLGLAVILLIGSIVAARVAGPAYPQRGVLVAAVALALWAIPAGTITEWLILANPQGGPPSSRPYWPLVAEYVWLLILMLSVAALGEMPLPGLVSLDGALIRNQWRRTLGLHLDRTTRSNGALALLVGTVVTGAVVVFFSAPAEAGQTLRGQVYFAVAVGSACGTFAAYRMAHVTDPIWYWPAPILAGLLGALAAAASPALRLPAAYSHLNSIPAWGLTRPLPIEMVGVGVAASLWALRASQRAARGRQA